MGAADKGRTDIARALLGKGARVAAVNHEHLTAMMYATKGQHGDIVALLNTPAVK
jgi:ankyrin repeat protein